MTYTAITIGPVIETLGLTSKPAGLWAASYLFSELSRQICKRLPKDDIISPYFESDERCGAGLFPDRIILKRNGISLAELDGIFNEAKKAAAKAFWVEFDENDEQERKRYQEFEDYLCGYLQVHAVEFATEGNPIKDLSPFVAMLENERYYTAQEQENKLLAVIEKKQDSDESACELVKKCTLVKKVLNGTWPLWADEPNSKIRNLANIASNDPQDLDGEKITSKWKKHRYYAVIQADGDNIGKHITGLKSDSEITHFSENCWHYSKRAAGIVRAYGGVTIYAGGDDLLALVPMENNDSKTVFDLIADIRRAFKTIFGPVGSLSFGVAVRFYKYPLYESIKAAQSLLFDEAKQAPGKNAIAFSLQKHSGQTIALLFPCGNRNFALTELNQQMKAVIQEMNSSPSSSVKIGNLLHSIMSHLRIYEKVFATAIDEDKTERAFENIFSEEIHKNHARIQGAQRLLSYCTDGHCCVSLIKDVPDHDRRLMTLDTMLRLLKFFTETGEEGDHA